MPKDISSLANDLIKCFELEFASQFKTIGNILIDDVREHIDLDVYAKYTPSDPMYERTFNLKRAVKKSLINKDENGETPNSAVGAFGYTGRFKKSMEVKMCKADKGSGRSK